jgi:hypothetical protein
MVVGHEFLARPLLAVDVGSRPIKEAIVGVLEYRYPRRRFGVLEPLEHVMSAELYGWWGQHAMWRLERRARPRRQADHPAGSCKSEGKEGDGELTWLWMW